MTILSLTNASFSLQKNLQVEVCAGGFEGGGGGDSEQKKKLLFVFLLIKISVIPNQ